MRKKSFDHDCCQLRVEIRPNQNTPVPERVSSFSPSERSKYNGKLAHEERETRQCAHGQLGKVVPGPLQTWQTATLWEAFAPHLSVSDTLEPSDQTLTCGVYITCIE